MSSDSVYQQELFNIDEFSQTHPIFGYNTSDQLNDFESHLPHKPWCTNSFNEGLVIRRKDYAIKKSHIQPNPPYLKKWIVYDVDRPGAGYDWYDRGAPTPNIVSENKKNLHAHLFYNLEVPVRMDIENGNIRSNPYRYLGSVECGLLNKLDADFNYTGLISKNPLHSKWNTRVYQNESYHLDDLAGYIDLSAFKDARKRLPEYQTSRNCTIFEKTRLWAYRSIQRHSWPTYNTWELYVQDRADKYNNEFNKPLPYGELHCIVKSISKWTWMNIDHSAGAFDRYVKVTHTPEIQRARNLKSQASRKKKSKKTQDAIINAYNENPDATQTEIAMRCGVSQFSVSRVSTKIDLPKSSTIKEKILKQLKDHPDYSCREIASIVGCSKSMVSKVSTNIDLPKSDNSPNGE